RLHVVMDQKDVRPPLEKVRRSPLATAQPRCRTGIEILRPSTDALCNACSRIGPTLFCGDFRLTPCQPRVRLLCAEVIPTVNPVLTGGVARYFLRLFRRK